MKFFTVPYTSSTDVPPQWDSLVLNNSELTSTADYNLAETWITSPTGEESNIIDSESLESFKDSEQSLEGEENLTNIIQETSKDSEQALEGNIKLTNIDSVQERVKTSTSVPGNFVDLETAGLR